jgi:anti-sigma B factor antagonist
MSSSSDFQHLRLSRLKDIVLVEIVSKDLRGPAAAAELGKELSLVTAQDWAKRIVLNFQHINYVSSTGFAVIFKLVSRVTAAGGQVAVSNMEPGLRLGAEIVGLDKVVPIHDTEAVAIASFEKS